MAGRIVNVYLSIGRLNAAIPLTMKEKILTDAEKRVRSAGLTEMSFRDLANDVGIKSASVQNHFPTKPDLSEALITRCAEQFKAELDKSDPDDLQTTLDGFVSLYSNALVLNESICLCAVMGAKAIGLPENRRLASQPKTQHRGC